MTDIAPCWWCGSASYWDLSNHAVECSNCYATGPALTGDKAIAAWNAGPRTVWHPIATAPRDRRIMVYSRQWDETLLIHAGDPIPADTSDWAELPKGPGK